MTQLLLKIISFKLLLVLDVKKKKFSWTFGILLVKKTYLHFENFAIQVLTVSFILVYNSVLVILLGYSCGNEDSLHNVRNIWLKELEEAYGQLSSTPEVVLVGNKLDLLEDHSKFNKKSINKSLGDLNLFTHLKCSALKPELGDGVKHVFKCVVSAGLGTYFALHRKTNPNLITRTIGRSKDTLRKTKNTLRRKTLTLRRRTTRKKSLAAALAPNTVLTVTREEAHFCDELSKDEIGVFYVKLIALMKRQQKYDSITFELCMDVNSSFWVSVIGVTVFQSESIIAHGRAKKEIEVVKRSSGSSRILYKLDKKLPSPLLAFH